MIPIVILARPCPFCGSLELFAARHNRSGMPTTRVFCQRCGARGPSYPGGVTGAAAWNERAYDRDDFEQRDYERHNNVNLYRHEP